MATTYAQQLDAIHIIIEKIESGVSSYSTSTAAGSRTYTHHDLKTLYDRESFLRIRAGREAGGTAGKIRTSRITTS